MTVRASREITLASYNIHLGIGNDGQFLPERIAGVLAELTADVIALQEVESGTGDFDMFAYLRDRVGFTAVLGPTLEFAGRQYGNALLTRCRVLEVRRIDLSVPRREPRGALDVVLDCGGQPVRVVCTHLGLRPAERRHQIRSLLRSVEGYRAMPTVLMGDINEWFLWGRPLRWLHRRFGSARAGRTFPARLPLFALDRIWVTPSHLLRSVRVHSTPLARAASDHLPLIARMATDTPAA
jgi:endonuclease/exonuclease/phosphatase family metal-dependent hydrolase